MKDVTLVVLLMMGLIVMGAVLAPAPDGHYPPQRDGIVMKVLRFFSYVRLIVGIDEPSPIVPLDEGEHEELVFQSEPPPELEVRTIQPDIVLNHSEGW